MDSLSPVDLPFNRRCLDDNFEFKVPDQDPGGPGLWLVVGQGNVYLAETATGLTLPAGEQPLAGKFAPLYIGQWQGQPCRLLVVAKGQTLPELLVAQSLRSSAVEIDLALISFAGLGVAIGHWEQVSQFCGDCGGTMTRIPGEWGKKCGGCGASHYPRIHPCVIGLVVRGDEVLLARKAEWPAGRYSLIAGFVDFGECLEEAMEREALEETNILIKNIRYVGSQSWPFPSQLMCGFVADYAGGEINLNDQELEDARWFKLDALPDLPPKRSISRYIIDHAASLSGLMSAELL